MALCLCFPDLAAASGGITEFSSPLEKVVNTITGPAGKWISIVAMALCGVIFIMNKDGSFLAGWEIRGQDTASSTESDLALVSSRFNNAVKLLGSGWMLHMDAIRSSHKAYPAPEKGHFPDPVTQLIDEERREHFSGNRCFSTSAILTVTYKPNFQAAKLAGKA